MKEALRLALDFIVATNKSSSFWLVPGSNLNKTVTSIKEALAQPEQEPSQASYPEYDRGFSEGWDRCKAAAQRPWVGLTDEQREECTQSPFTEDNYQDIEDKLRELNT